MNSSPFLKATLSAFVLSATVIALADEAKPVAPAPAPTAAAAPAAAPKPSPFPTLNQKVSYGIGYNVGRSFAAQKADLTVDAEALIAGIQDGVAGAQTRISGQELQAAFEAVAQRAADKQKAEVQAFFEKNRARPGVVVTPSGLQYEVLAHGTGTAKPKATDTVTVNYKGTLLDGTMFDSSDAHGGPQTFVVNQVIAGWTEGLQLMSAGDKFRFYVPAGLGYGQQGSGRIPPNSTLIFDVELVSIK